MEDYKEKLLICVKLMNALKPLVKDACSNVNSSNYMVHAALDFESVILDFKNELLRLEEVL